MGRSPYEGILASPPQVLSWGCWCVDSNDAADDDHVRFHGVDANGDAQHFYENACTVQEQQFSKASVTDDDVDDVANSCKCYDKDDYHYEMAFLGEATLEIQ